MGFLTSLDHVVDLEYHTYGLSGELDGTGGDKEGLDNVLLVEIGDGSLADVDACRGLSLGVTVSQLGNDGDGVQAGVLSECVGDGLESLGEGANAIGLHAAQSLRVLLQLHSHLNLGGSSSDDQELELNNRADDAKSVVQ